MVTLRNKGISKNYSFAQSQSATEAVPAEPQINNGVYELEVTPIQAPTTPTTEPEPEQEIEETFNNKNDNDELEIEKQAELIRRKVNAINQSKPQAEPVRRIPKREPVAAAVTSHRWQLFKPGVLRP